MAVNAICVPLAIAGAGGVSAIERSVAAVTVSVAAPVIPERLALIDAVPAPTASARPRLPAAFDGSAYF